MASPSIQTWLLTEYSWWDWRFDLSSGCQGSVIAKLCACFGTLFAGLCFAKAVAARVRGQVEIQAIDLCQKQFSFYLPIQVVQNLKVLNPELACCPSYMQLDQSKQIGRQTQVSH